MSEDTMTAPEPQPGAQTFRLVDATKAATAGAGGCGCGGKGHGGGHGGHGGGGCGCGGKGHGHAHAAPAAPTQGGCGCGGHGQRQAAEAPATTGGCGCGGKGHAHGHAHAAPASAVEEELVVHSIPRVIRHAVLFHAMDVLPEGESVVVRAPHQPEPLFEHLRTSLNHYRVETLDAGPEAWRYRVTRLS